MIKNIGTQTHDNPQLDDVLCEDVDNNRILVLYNDEVNTFDHVISCLIEICKHDEKQAEQCAFITHYKGKCDVKEGGFDELKLMKDQLVSKGLSAVVE